jgi:CBS domain containing-hemolysin-like protein
MNGYKLLLIFALMAVNAFFAAAEVALLSTRRSKLEALAREGALGAQAALSLLANPERLISLIQAAMAITTLGLGSAGEEMIRRQIEALFLPLAGKIPAAVTQTVSFILSFLVLTLTVVVVGEVVPKNIGVARADRLAVIAAPVLLLFYRIAEPFILLIEKVASKLSSWLGARGSAHGAHSAEELKYIVQSARHEGHLTEFEDNAVRRVLELNEYVAREVMTPRHSVVSVPVESTLDELLLAFTNSHHSRMPVWRDRPENVIGLVHFRDLLAVWQQRRTATERRRSVPQFRLDLHLRKPFVIPETKLLSELIDEFRSSHVHMAIVVDEFGTVSGVITLEDVLEQVFGEIEDEHDTRREPVLLEAPVTEFDGATPIVDLESQYGIPLPAEAGFETLAGFLLYRLGHLPKPGESVLEADRRYTVLDMERNRIARVRVERIEASPRAALDPAFPPAT